MANGFNYQELVKIKKATSASSKTKLKIADALHELTPEIEEAKKYHGEKRSEMLVDLVNQYTNLRQNALKNGASSHADPRWAVPAVCESWLHGLLIDSPEEISKIEAIITDLKDPNRPEEKSSNNFWGYLVVLAGVVSFIFLSWWLSIIILISGFVILGWSKRYDGPFEVK